MDTTSIHREPATFTLTRVHADGREEVVETATDHVTAIEHGFRLSRTEPDHGFSLYRGDRRVHKFCHDRLMLRVKPGSVEMLVG